MVAKARSLVEPVRETPLRAGKGDLFLSQMTPLNE